MRETQRSTKEIVRDMLSGDSFTVWQASCEIASLSQNHDRVMEVARHWWKIRLAMKNSRKKNSFVSQRQFVRRALEVVEFHKSGKECPCCLLGMKSNPRHLIEDGYIEQIEFGHRDYENNDYWVLRCKRCKKLYQVEELEYHFPWWEWKQVNEE